MYQLSAVHLGGSIVVSTLWLFNIAMENCPFIDGLPIKNGGSFHGYVSHNQMVYDVTFLNYSWNAGQLSPGKPPPGRCRPTLSRFKMYVFTLFVNSCFQNVLLPCMFHSCLPKIVQIWQNISSLPESDTTYGINPMVDHVFKGLLIS